MLKLIIDSSEYIIAPFAIPVLFYVMKADSKSSLPEGREGAEFHGTIKPGLLYY